MRTVEPAVQFESKLHRDGFVRMDSVLGESEFVALGRYLGEIVDDTPVRIVPGKRTYLARPDPIPFHTDHPKADLIAWRCESQDARDGASLLVDSHRVIEALGAQDLAGLEVLRLPAMVRLGDEATPTPILSREGAAQRVFYVPWLEPIGRPIEAHDALVAFRDALAREQENCIRVRLEPGQVLIVENHRMLHGRGQLLPDSTRKLRRLWINTGRHSAASFP